ncbi:MAG TPA: hypothetical protein VEV84_07630, partial [Pyrinomonadaceae bacterium]|nr:hypothetical protein [Pyrinomonadaceae bacterium]
TYAQNLSSKWALSFRDPDGWFRLYVPKLMSRVQRHADVDGGFYTSKEFEINYDYWPLHGHSKLSSSFWRVFDKADSCLFEVIIRNEDKTHRY